MCENFSRFSPFCTPARNPPTLNLSGFRLRPLKGERKGQRAASVMGNVRVAFDFEGAKDNPETWMHLQMQYDHRHAERPADSIKVTRFPGRALAWCMPIRKYDEREQAPCLLSFDENT
jgi:hypothetical protein